MKILGSLNELGNWNSYKNKGLDLNWNNGNIWKAKIPFNKNFEYKFVFVENEIITKWETGGNRVFNYKDIIKNINKNELDKDGKINFINDDFNIYQYDLNNEKIIIKSYWKN